MDTNLLVPVRATRQRGVLLELHHDGTVVAAVDLSHKLCPQAVRQWSYP
ncbi:hypothetical protein ACWGDT_20975 [Streptomyces avermitilis]